MIQIHNAMKSSGRATVFASTMFRSVYCNGFDRFGLLHSHNYNDVNSIQAKYAHTILQQQQQQQIRFFVAKVKYSMKGFGPNGNALKICFCYNDHDLYAKPKTPNHEKYQYFKSQYKLSEIKEKTKEEFDTCENLEYFNGTEWTPLVNIKDLAPWKGGVKVLNIRVPSRWDDYIHERDIEGLDGNGDDDDAINDGEFNGSRDMKEVIEALVLTCKLTDTTRSKVKPYHLQCGKTEISTKQWILNEAENDKLLRTIILHRPGTLDHMVQCLHFDMTWRKVKDIDPKADPMYQNDVQFGNISRSFSV
jgi:hypothetical protein